MADVESRFELIWLMDFYGAMLTEHRREVVRLYCEEDLSLADIAEQLSITRQGVSDALKKARTQLEDYEEKLGLAARYRALGDEAQRCMDALEKVKGADGDAKHLSEARHALENIINER